MSAIKNIIIPGATGKPISIDIFYTERPETKPVVVYAHGFNGSKDRANFIAVTLQQTVSTG